MRDDALMHVVYLYPDIGEQRKKLVDIIIFQILKRDVMFPHFKSSHFSANFSSVLYLCCVLCDDVNIKL